MMDAPGALRALLASLPPPSFESDEHFLNREDGIPRRKETNQILKAQILALRNVAVPRPYAAAATAAAAAAAAAPPPPPPARSSSSSSTRQQLQHNQQQPQAASVIPESPAATAATIAAAASAAAGDGGDLSIHPSGRFAGAGGPICLLERHLDEAPILDSTYSPCGRFIAFVQKGDIHLLLNPHVPAAAAAVPAAAVHAAAAAGRETKGRASQKRRGSISDPSSSSSSSSISSSSSSSRMRIRCRVTSSPVASVSGLADYVAQEEMNRMEGYWWQVKPASSTNRLLSPGPVLDLIFFSLQGIPAAAAAAAAAGVVVVGNAAIIAADVGVW